MLSSKWSFKRAPFVGFVSNSYFSKKGYNPASSNSKGQRKTVRVSGVREKGVNWARNLTRGEIKRVRESGEFELAGFYYLFKYPLLKKKEIIRNFVVSRGLCIHLGSEWVD